MSKRLLTFMLVLLTLGGHAFAQSSVYGKVTDASGEPLAGVNVMIQGTMTGTMTTLDGDYSIPAKQGQVLVFSCIGYASENVKVGSASVLNVVLKSDNTFLDEVVVVAYGTQRRKDLTGSMSEIKSEVVSIQNTTTVTRALEGAAPGIQVAAVDGQPGYDMAIRLRGVSSTNGASAAALIVIDGVAQQTNSTYENPLSQLNPDDIESVSVLKDAASTALYGSRAGNGVVLITTKKGREGKSKISFQARAGFNQIGNYNSKTIDTAAGYYEYAWQSIYNSYRYGVGGKGAPGVDANGNYFTNAKTPVHSDQDARMFASKHLFDYVGSETNFQRNSLGNNLAYKVPGATFTPTGAGSNASATMGGAYLIDPNTGRINPDATLLYDDNAADELFSQAFRQQYDISASGGTDKIHYFASLGFQSDPSYLRASSYKRLSGRLNVDADVTSWMKIGANVAYSSTDTRAQAGKWGSRQIGAASGNALYYVKAWAPIVPLWEMAEDGTYALDDNGDKVLNVHSKSYSPLGTASGVTGSDFLYVTDNNLEQQKIGTWTTRLYSNIHFLQHFDFNVRFNLDQRNWRRDMYMNSLVGRASGAGSYGIKTSDRNIINTQQILTYNQDFGKAHVDVMVGHEYEAINVEYLNYGTRYELIPGVIVPYNFVGRYSSYGGENSTTPSFSSDVYRTESYLSRANFNYDQKYYLSASLRRDASSKFTKNNRWGTFWSVGAGWRFSEESFLEGAKTWLDNAKLRTSYGVTGNSNGLTTWYLNHGWAYGVTSFVETTNGSGVPDVTKITEYNALVNNQLTWENIHQFDLGVDFSLLKSRITGAIDYYNNITVNSLFNQSVSPLASVGATTRSCNAAQVGNKGIEIELSADIIRTKDFTFNVAINGTHYRTTLLGVPEDQIPAWDETMDIPKGCWSVQTEDMATAGTAGHAGRGIFYLRGVGRDLFNLYMPKYAGVDQESGLPLYWHRVSYYDVNPKSTGLYNCDGRYAEYKVGDNVRTDVAADASYYEVGSATPDWIGGLTLNFRYKSFDLSIVSAYQFGGKFFSMEYSQILYRGSSLSLGNMPVSQTLVGNTWSPDNTNAKFPMQWFYNDNSKSYYLDGAYLPGTHNYTDMSLFDASYFRLKNITVGYTLPKKLCQKVKMEGLRVFASADNLLLYSAQAGVDPTLSTIGGKEVDTYVYPQMQTFTLGINLDF